MVLSRKGRERALMGRRSGCPLGGPVGARCLPEPRRRNSRGVRMARSRPADLPGTAGVLAGIVDDGAPALRGSAGFRNGRERASRGPARTPALPGEARAGTGNRAAAPRRPVIPERPDRPRPERPPAPRPANPAIANPAIPDPGTAPTRRSARFSRNSRNRSPAIPERRAAPGQRRGMTSRHARRASSSAKPVFVASVS